MTREVQGPGDSLAAAGLGAAISMSLLFGVLTYNAGVHDANKGDELNLVPYFNLLCQGLKQGDPVSASMDLPSGGVIFIGSDGAIAKITMGSDQAAIDRGGLTTFVDESSSASFDGGGRRYRVNVSLADKGKRTRVHVATSCPKPGK